MKLKKGVKYDSGKLQWDKFLWKECEAIMEIIQFGAMKYDWNNFKKVPDGKARYLAALFRHAIAYATGEANDPETGKSHLAHAGCNLLFLLNIEREKSPHRLTRLEDVIGMPDLLNKDQAGYKSVEFNVPSLTIRHPKDLIKSMDMFKIKRRKK